jgi:hypothetical protein
MKYTVHASGVEPNSPEVGINSRYEASVGGGTLPRLPPVTKASRTGQRLALPLCVWNRQMPASPTIGRGVSHALTSR